MSDSPCASGAHFRGGCQCIGPRGLRHREEDQKLGIVREWKWYFAIYGADRPLTYDEQKAFGVL